MDFEASVAIHPTVAEEFVTFGGWGQSKDKDPRTVRTSVRVRAASIRRSVALLHSHAAALPFRFKLLT